MSSGSLKDLTKAITSTISTPSLPLPSPLLEILQNYLAKHPTPDNDHSQRLQDELLAIYNTQVANSPSRLAPFLAILRTLKPAIRGSGRLLQWWEKLSANVLNNLGTEKGLAHEARDTLLGILVWEDDEDEEEDARADIRATGQAVAESLVGTWILKSKSAMEDFDQQAQFVEGQIQIILLSFGKKRPKDFLSTINKFFVKKESRILALSLLCEFIRHQPPHLHQLLQTPLFENLLKCLQVDTSTRVISLAMTALIMFLPHIPSSLSAHLPALFNIYSRMLFWERERRAAGPLTGGDEDEVSEENEKQPATEGSTAWVKMSYLLESDDETVPELLHYFTFLYGLYPINFMSYIRKPQRYLRHANFPGADDLDIEPTEIRQRSESFRQVHLLHPNFFMLTIESELTDNNRWMKSEAADVVAECMALYTPGDDNHGQAIRSRGPARKIDLNSDIPEQPLLEGDAQTPYQSRHTSWRDTRSTAVASPDGCRSSGLQRKTSQTSQSLVSIADSPCFRPTERDGSDSPTIPPQMLGSPSHNQLSDMLNTQRSTRGSIYQSLTNDSVASLTLSHTNHDSSAHIDNYLASLTRETVHRSPSLRAVTVVEPALKVAYLHREIQLLRNDLNFEQYLKAQHLSHIGQLRRKQIREARVEAETQNLINSNRRLKSKLEESKRINLQTKKETEKSKTHARKWEADLSSKLRVLREEQKKWTVERENLKHDLSSAIENADCLRQLVVSSESRELAARQKVMSVESSLDELERLRGEVERLTLSLRTYEAGENLAVKARENEESARREVTLLEMQLRARDKELFLSKQAFEAELHAARNAKQEDESAVGGEDSNGNARKKTAADVSQDLLDSALSSSRNRIMEIQKAHNHLLRRYTALQNQYMDLKEQIEQYHIDLEEPLLSGGPSTPRQSLTHSESYNPSPATRPLSKRSNTISENETWDSPNSMPSSPVPTRSVRLDTTHISTTPTSGRSPISGGASHYMGAEPFLSMMSGGSGKGKDRESMDADSLDAHGKVKVKPQSEIRVYGRGGVQNIGKKDKDKKEKGKEKESGKDGEGKEAKKEKKSVGIRGIRGFV